jgi:hypothetical protein
LNVYDATGRLVRLFNLESCIMDHALTVRWDGTDHANRQLPGGIYFIRLDDGKHTITKKITLIR